jgi:cell division septum initiation protein DivIVA
MVTDSGMKGRVKGLLGGPSMGNEPMDRMDGPHEPPSAQAQALQVLTLAQRTADEHLASARREADRIRGEARAAADQIARDAQAQAQGLHKEAEKVLADARAKAMQIARDAQGNADKAQRKAEEILADARSRADEMGKNAQANAEELKHLAQQKYDDVVGSLAGKREALQQQIEALEQFERDYRNRLSTFMQNQLRALWVDEPKVDAEAVEEPAPVPAQRKA